MEYIEVAFSCKQIEEWQQDLLIQDLAEIGFDSFEQNEYGFLAFISAPNFNVIALETLLSQLDPSVILSYQVKNIEQKNWNKAWEDNFQPLTIGKECYVRATFHPSKANQYPFEIVIDPKMAFGTGHHQTTSLMMEHLLLIDVSGARVLDMGCGTGILGILAKKRGAKEVVAVDYDPVCVDSTKENSQLNQVSLEVYEGSVEAIPAGTYQLIIANINRNILLEQLPAYAEKIAPQGILLLSGFYLGEDLAQLQALAESLGFRYIENKNKDNWTAAKFIKSSL